MSNYYLDFDGSNDYVTVPHNSLFDIGTGDFSYSIWVKPDDLSGNYILFSKLSSIGYIGLIDSPKSSASLFCVSGVQSGSLTSNDNTLTAGQWNHVVFSVSRTSPKVYINGQDQTSRTDSKAVTNTLSNSGDFIVGFVAANPKFPGGIDDVRFYDRALTQAEAEYIYNSGDGSKGTDATSPLMSLDFDEGTGTTTTDSIAGLVGTFTGSPAWTSGGTSSTNAVRCYYDIDDGGWVLAGKKAFGSSYTEHTFYINRTGKRIRFKFVGSGSDFKIREYKIMEPEIEDDR
jgi:hypothetical protein